jgi:signal transduction histidine kinase
MDFLHHLFSTDGFMPHGMCYEWNPMVIWLHVTSDALITVAYYSIPITLMYFVRKRKDLAFDWIFICFAVFIVACGTTHLMEIINIWHPIYWLSGIIKAITAVASITTAILLINLVPKALSLPSPDQLRQTNKALENEIRDRVKASEKIEALNRDLVDKTTKLEASNRELEAFSASVAHDFRAPLRVIIGYAEMEMNENEKLLPAGTRNILERIISSALRLNKMMTDLLEYHRVNREELPLVEINLDSFLADLIKEGPFQGGRFEIQPGLGVVSSNPVALNLILWNLIGNALKFIDDGVIPKVQITSEMKENRLTLFLRDNGVGIDPADQKHLFKLFYRGQNAKSFMGTGLGLGTALKAAHRVGATLYLVSSSREGSCFSITFPPAD